MTILKALEFIATLFVIFEFELILNYKSMEHERKKYLVITSIMCIPAIVLSLISIIVSIILLGIYVEFFYNLILLFTGIIIEVLLFRKIKSFSEKIC